MSEKGQFLQNIIAIIWDFDKTLSPEYMQGPLFREYGVDSDTFWAEVHDLPAYYLRAGIHIQPDISYLGHLLNYVRCGRMKGLSNARLRNIGGQLDFYPGVLELFGHLQETISSPPFREGDLRLEHYVVSTGLAELIRGSKVSPFLSGIWASEFIETPATPGAPLTGAPPPGEISQIATFLDNTTKTRAIFEINKGVNIDPDITVNDSIPEDERRVPMRNMIYIADGPSDIPSFSVVRKHGGRAYAVYAPGRQEHFDQAQGLLDSKRVDGMGPADYTEGGQTHMWLRREVVNIATRILGERKQAFKDKVKRGPVHIEDE